MSMNTVFKKEIEDISASYDLLEDSLENLKNKILQEYMSTPGYFWPNRRLKIDPIAGLQSPVFV